MVATRWLQAFPGATIVGQTNGTTSHARLRGLGLTPRVKADAAPGRRFANLVFSAPPSGSTDYAAEARGGLERGGAVQRSSGEGG